ncbi:MAG TPA: glycoside hydrolase family 15 protein [Thermoanaerobaculia bacterium]
MPRDLPISNGRLMINFDHEGNIRDVYYPHVGQENQTVGDVSFFGAWADGHFAWLGNPSWKKRLEYEEETLVTKISAVSDVLGLELTVRDLVDFDRDLFVRRVDLVDRRMAQRKVRLYIHFDGHLWGNAVGDTVYFEPQQRSLIAYKGHRYVLMNARVGDAFGFQSFAIGQKERPGLQGTWRDAEDGNLARHPIAQGSVDSTGMIEFEMAPGSAQTAWFWWAFGRNYGEVDRIDTTVRERGPASFHDRTRDYWRLWVNKDRAIPLDGLPSTVRNLYKRSLLVLRTQIDAEGAVIAATDSDIVQFGKDTYTYMWPRDGALVTHALIEAGYSDVSRNFFRFCQPLFTSEGFLLHKYNPDGSVGSSWHPWSTPEGGRQLPIQEDETALVVWALWNHFEKFRDVEFVRDLYKPIVKAAADFLVRYRETHTRLPAASHDLWEERRGIHSFTVATVWAGLRAAARFAEAFGETKVATRYQKAADEIRAAAVRFLFDAKRNRFIRMINVSHDGAVTPDVTIDASIAGLWQFGMFASDDPRIVATMDAMVKRLTIQTPVGGVARYENDYYHQVSKDVERVAGNPWIICTMWAAEWMAERASTERELDGAIALLQWAVDHALPSGVLAEQLDPFTGAPLSVSPLTWSHAAYVSAVHRIVARQQAIAPKRGAIAAPVAARASTS